MIQLLGALYTLAAAILAVYGLVGLVTLFLFIRHRRDKVISPEPLSDQTAPAVTIQLPVYNEPLVIEQLIDTVAAMDYPTRVLQIQVLDDSTDETTELAARCIAKHLAAGIDIELIHRDQRTGFKGGALQEGLIRAKGDFISIFDADFDPPANFLRQTIPYFFQDPNLGMVQTRWGHTNADYSALTRAQAISLDKHFIIEQLVRHRAGLFPKFNGSAGVWRKSCVLQAGGWSSDTVCEDLDLSTRTQLDGWRFLFLPDVISPAELPPQMSSFKIQQARWAKGSLQCAKKYWRQILFSRRHSLLGRFYALFAMTGYLAQPLMLVLLTLLPPLLYFGYDFSPLLACLSAAGIAQPLLFLLSQQALYPNWRQRSTIALPALVIVAMGLAPSNTWSIGETLFKKKHTFYRTPKYNLKTAPEGGWTRLALRSFPISGKPQILLEIGLALYALAGAVVALAYKSIGSIPFLLLCSASLGATAALSLGDLIRARNP